MNRDDLLRRKAEIEREFAEIQGQIAAWDIELTPVGARAAPAIKRDRKKYGVTAVARRGRREVSQIDREARMAELTRKAPLEPLSAQWTTLRCSEGE